MIQRRLGLSKGQVLGRDPFHFNLDRCVPLLLAATPWNSAIKAGPVSLTIGILTDTLALGIGNRGTVTQSPEYNHFA